LQDPQSGVVISFRQAIFGHLDLFFQIGVGVDHRLRAILLDRRFLTGRHDTAVDHHAVELNANGLSIGRGCHEQQTRQGDQTFQSVSHSVSPHRITGNSRLLG